MLKSKTKTEVGPHIDSQNIQVEEEEQMCEILNNYFSSGETGGLSGARK